MPNSLLQKILLALVSIVFLGASGCSQSIFTYSKQAERDGLKLFEQKDYQGAAGAFENAIKWNSGAFVSHYHLGVCRDEMGQHQLAMQSYKTGLQVMKPPFDTEASELRAKLTDRLAQSIALHDVHDTELNAQEKQVQNNPTAAGFFLLARVYLYRKDADLAIENYNQALLYDPNNFLINKELGLYLLDSLNQPKQAELPLRRAYVLNSEDPEVIGALRRINVIPGPSLKREDQLAKPPLPKGPLPEIKIGPVVPPQE